MQRDDALGGRADRGRDRRLRAADRDDVGPRAQDGGVDEGLAGHARGQLGGVQVEDDRRLAAAERRRRHGRPSLADPDRDVPEGRHEAARREHPAGGLQLGGDLGRDLGHVRAPLSTRISEPRMRYDSGMSEPHSSIATS